MHTPSTNFVAELRWRGMIHDIMPGAEEQLMKEMTAGYVGIDPTADSLHIGHLVSIMMLKHLQLAGHKPFALVGGATGMIGDPSGKSEERNLLSEDVLRYNVECIKKQLGRFLDYESGENRAEIVNNYDWFKDMGFLTFLRDVGKHLTVNYMMAKDSVQKRLETGISYTEFTYQLVQGYDFYHLYKEKKCKLQMGGSDQWGNIVTGTELIRRKTGGEAFALTCPLITKADGSKFGKTEGGNVWLDPQKTSPYKFYQFWINVSDVDAARYIRIFTLLSQEEIESTEAEHGKAPEQRLLQKRLAEEITVLVHGREEYDGAVEATEVLFGKGTMEAFQKIKDETLLAALEGVPTYEVDKNKLEPGINIVDLLSMETDIFPSKGEAKKLIQSGGLSLNKSKIVDASLLLNREQLLRERFLLVQKGRKNYYLVQFV